MTVVDVGTGSHRIECPVLGEPERTGAPMRHAWSHPDPDHRTIDRPGRGG
jgi:hypothetical protein